MPSISTNDFSTGITLKIEGNLFDLVEFQFVKPGKGAAFVRTRLKNLKTGAVKEITFASQAKVEQVIVDKREMEYLYRDGQNYVFMNPDTFDQVAYPPETVDELLPFLKENTRCNVKLAEGELVSISLPDHMVLKVTETTPWVKGSTASGGNKPATLETGTVIQVPVYLNPGEWVRVDTRTKKYLDRAKAPE